MKAKSYKGVLELKEAENGGPQLRDAACGVRVFEENTILYDGGKCYE